MSLIPTIHMVFGGAMSVFLVVPRLMAALPARTCTTHTFGCYNVSKVYMPEFDNAHDENRFELNLFTVLVQHSHS